MKDVPPASSSAGTVAPAPAAVEELTILQSIRTTLAREMSRDERTIVFGQDVAQLGGVFRVTKGLASQFPNRVFDMPLSEAGIIGASVGLAVAGLVPIPELQFFGFAHQAFHQIAPQLARYRYRSRGRFSMPVTVRMPFGGGMRMPEFHADALEAQFLSTPGLKIVCPAFPDDARGLLANAIRDPDPVLFLEPQRLYRRVAGPVPSGDHLVPFAQARLVREGADVTLVSWSAAVHTCLEAAQILATERISAAVLDMRCLSPFDEEGLVSAVASTGRAVIVHEGTLTGGFGAELAATLQSRLFHELKCPTRRVACHDVPYPPGGLEKHFLPLPGRIVEQARNACCGDRSER